MPGKSTEQSTRRDKRGALAPDSGHATRTLAEVLIANFDHGTALRAAERAVELEPANADGWWALARAQIGVGNRGAAAASTARVCELAPRSSLAHHARGFLALQRGRGADAEYEYRAALAIKPDHAVYLSNLGAALLARGRTSEAQELFVRAAQIEPTNQHYRANIARAARQHVRGNPFVRLNARLMPIVHSDHRVAPYARRACGLAILGAICGFFALLASSYGWIVALVALAYVALRRQRRRRLPDLARQALREQDPGFRARIGKLRARGRSNVVVATLIWTGIAFCLITAAIAVAARWRL